MLPLWATSPTVPGRRGTAERDRPKGRVTEIAHHAEAVRPDQREALAAERAQLGLQRLAVLTRLREAAAERDPALRAGSDRLPDHPGTARDGTAMATASTGSGIAPISG